MGGSSTTALQPEPLEAGISGRPMRRLEPVRNAVFPWSVRDFFPTQSHGAHL